MKVRRPLLPLLLLPLLLLGLPAVSVAQEAPPAAGRTPTPAALTLEDFSSLAWLEGRWVGSGGGFNAFYEAYRFVNDSTLEQTTYSDASFGDPDGVSTIRLRDGHALKYRDGRAESMIARLVPDTVRVERIGGTRPGFTWYRSCPDEWTAVLGRTSGESIVYTLRRMP